MTSTVRAALIYPPLTDPTSGYHSLNYIDSYARAQGHAPADIIDANIEAFHYSYSPGGLAWLERELSAPGGGGPDASGSGAALNGLGRAALDGLGRAARLGLADPDPDRVRRSVQVLQDPELFYDYGHYQDAVEGVIAWMDVLGTTGIPGQFRAGFRLQSPPALSIGSLAALTDHDLLARLNRPFQPYYTDVLLPRLAAGNYQVIGISTTYQWQLPFTLWLARLIKQTCPDAFLITGGTEISDLWKCATDRRHVFEILTDFDAIVVGEGETAYTEILDAVAVGTLPAGHPNVRLHPRFGAQRLLPLRYERLAQIPTPDFSGLPWDLYLSPERFVYYAPSRGCYWNKCTFCDYGLNTDGPTSPWRQDTADTMVRDVAQLSKFAKFIYFSVDVLAPATILRFAEKVIEQDLDFRWGAEIRLEKYWSDQRCATLRRSGCVAVSVGFESGNQRVLDLIDKGTRPAQVRQTMQAMAGAGIGVQMMGFTGFPTETSAEALESIDFLVDNRDLWTFGGLGEFKLTPGAIIAKDPDRFGITNVRSLPESDVVRVLDYDEPISAAARDEVTAAKRQLDGAHYQRPWLGSTDTPHSFFYHDRYGTSVREVMDAERRRRRSDDEQLFIANGTFVEPPEDAELWRLYRRMVAMQHGLGSDGEVPLSRQLFRRADAEVFTLNRSSRLFLDIFGEPVTLAAAQQRSWMVPSTVADRLWDTFISQRLIRRYRDPADRPSQ
ncbi:radical SAM protein [Solwaraspora sp. WMMD937]|uniref:B12-binding domain-containing radical SAM protein n=1 Tax=Solwaraspora sp. WMMD937 TaxID=3016090 RepID=UPI00249B4D40|nr:radical SAM protein [Solwaraspora sp. WMMD937]WFE22194.1 radical SAM protein [Solwaraspora sp. WMMD937]